MIKSEEELKEKVIEIELRGGEEPTDEERVPADQYEGDQDITDTTPAEAMKEADQGEKIIEKLRHRGDNNV